MQRNIHISMFGSYFLTKSKGKGPGSCYSTAYMSQSLEQKCFTNSEVAADWHESTVSQRIMWLS